MFFRKQRLLNGVIATIVCASYLSSALAATIKIAPIGDSITMGIGSSDYWNKGYPGVLRGLLGSGYDVQNFGHSSITVPGYKTTQECAAAKTYLPDVLIVCLGTNDIAASSHATFVQEYQALIDAFLGLTTTNAARLASPTASSMYSGRTALGMNDGVVGGYPGFEGNEWISFGEKAGAWAQLTWDSAMTIDSITLWDRPNTDDQILSGLLTFSDGSSIAVGALPNNAATPWSIKFAAKTVSWVKLTVNSVASTSYNAGLSEFGVFNTTMLAAHQSYQASPKTIYVCLPPWIAQSDGTYTDARLTAIFPEIEQVAQSRNATVIDLHSATINHPDYYAADNQYGSGPYGVHPNDAGYQAIAQKVYCVLQQQCGSTSVRAANSLKVSHGGMVAKSLTVTVSNGKQVCPSSFAHPGQTVEIYTVQGRCIGRAVINSDHSVAIDNVVSGMQTIVVRTK